MLNRKEKNIIFNIKLNVFADFFLDLKIRQHSLQDKHGNLMKDLWSYLKVKSVISES